ncbi:hypothetical protein D9756_001478 [Leucocoprinus leucothites]|uniref:SHSP domain-containing protein n=1 Tax=Leucocoprinus leucothites TaxID=201217 RepID=A0A8H5LI81_9AGAR|nr:hypothetical protein D9756_001478 [Leucoagaricus leucothites]
MDQEHPNFWASLVSVCERQSFRDLVHLVSYAMGTRDFDGNLLDPHPPAVVILPPVDRHEDVENNQVTLRVELPGIRRDGVNLALLGDELTVSGTKVTVFGHGVFVQRERRYGRFTRTLKITPGISSLSDITVSMEDGVLALTFPKTIA